MQDDKREELAGSMQSQQQLTSESEMLEFGLSQRKSASESRQFDDKAKVKDNCPVIFDIVMNIENLYSIGAIEEEMELATAYYRALGESAYVVNERFQVIDEVRDCVALFNSLNDVLTASWDLMYEKACSYYKENGDLNVPHRYITADGYSLGSWVSTQRAVRAGTMHGSLSQTQIRKLTAIGMVWESRTELAWAKNYNAAKAYHEEYGTLNAPADYVSKDGVALGAWLSNIRKWKSAGIHQKYLTPERIDQLTELGMVWDLHDNYWEQMYRKATEYYQEHGNLKVPMKYITEDGMRLGSWIHRQRNLGKGRNAGKETNVEKCSSNLTATRNGANENGSDKRSSNETDSTARGEQVWNGANEDDGDKQNRSTSPSGLSEERIARLNAIGMIWTEGNEANWDRNYGLAKQYYLTHGHLSIPRKYETDGVNLGYWITRQKVAYHAGKLSDYRKAKLEAIGIEPKTVA